MVLRDRTVVSRRDFDGYAPHDLLLVPSRYDGRLFPHVWLFDRRSTWLFRMTREIMWIEENLEGLWSYVRDTYVSGKEFERVDRYFSFEREEDAVAFTLYMERISGG